MAYLGRQLDAGSYLKLDDISSGFNGSTKNFSLTSGGTAFYPGSSYSILVSLANIIQEAENISSNSITLGNPETSDIVDISSITNDAPEFFPLGETIVTWTATDTSGNSVSDTQSIIIEDTIKPLITGPENITLEITDVSGMTVDIGNAFALDQVDRNPKITNDAPELFQLGNTIITWIATDSSDNSSLFFQTVTIIDTAAPEMIPPNNIIQEAENI